MNIGNNSFPVREKQSELTITRGERKKGGEGFMKTYEELMDEANKKMSTTRVRLYKQKMKADADRNQMKLKL